jgi:hypothetical protein
MKEFTVLLFTIALIFITVGYLDLKLNSIKNKKSVEYIFVPRSVFEEISSADSYRSYNDIFDQSNVLSERGSINPY